MKHIIVFLSLLIVSALGQSCYDFQDHLINGRCFKLVNKQLSYYDAVGWCHSQNAYLATVPDPTTANFLASYARTTFNLNDGNFWIGLSRSTSTSKYTWDSGYPLGWTNFNVQNAGIFVAESVTNAKWNTFGVDAKFNFICSYDPKSPPTFGSTYPVYSPTEPAWEETTTEPDFVTTEPIASQETTTSSDVQCKPSNNGFIFFAYSNDLDKTTVQDAVRVFYGGSRDFITSAFNVRMDTMHPGVIYQSETLLNMYESVMGHLPDPSLGFPSRSTGSDVLDILRSFVSFLHLNYTPESMCGGSIYLLMSRASDQTVYSKLVYDLQQFHIYVYSLSPNIPTGGVDSQAVFNISAFTNGLGVFSNAANFRDSWEQLTYSYDSFRNPIYAVNYMVQGNNNRTMPLLYIPLDVNLCTGGVANLRFRATIQGHAYSPDVFQSFTFYITNQRTGNKLTYMVSHDNLDKGSNFYLDYMNFDCGTYYQFNFAYDYWTQQANFVEFRFSPASPPPYFQPYSGFLN